MQPGPQSTMGSVVAPRRCASARGHRCSMAVAEVDKQDEAVPGGANRSTSGAKRQHNGSGSFALCER
jgi:hypothetical protein